MKIGIDIIATKRIKCNNEFAKKILSLEEYEYYKNLKNIKIKKIYLCSRWALKEALYKCDNSLDSYVNITISKESSNDIFVKGNKDKYSISLSHEKDYCVGVAIKIK